MAKQILLVGERFNLPRNPSLERALSMGVMRWVHVSRRLGALQQSPRLAAIGLPEDVRDSLNLLPPASQADKWDAAKAAMVAGYVDRLAFDEGYRAIVYVGRRVATAFGHKRWPFYHSGESSTVSRLPAIIVPHPSGLNRAWNEENEVDLGRDMVGEWLSTLKINGEQ